MMQANAEPVASPRGMSRALRTERRARREGLTPEEFAILEQHRKNASHKAKREVLEKAAAILVALAWSHAFSEVIPKTARYLQIVLAVCMYITAWIVASALADLLGHMTFEQYTLFAAEFTAFLCRDASKVIWQSLSSAIGLGNEEDGQEGKGDFQLGMAWLAWAMALLLVAVVFFAGMKRLRRAICKCGLEVRSERVAEAMLDVDKDACGLTIGWTLQAAINIFFLGSEWEEIVENGTDIGLQYFGLVLGVCLIVGMVLALLAKTGISERGSLTSMILTATGFLSGFLLNMFFGSIFGAHRMSWKILGPLTMGQLAYPFILLGFGAKIVAKKKVRGSRQLARDSRTKCWGLCNPKQLKLTEEITILAYQVAMALAFEELLDIILEALRLESAFARFGLAVGLNFLWAILCFVLSRLEVEPEESDEEGGEEEGADVSLGNVIATTA